MHFIHFNITWLFEAFFKRQQQQQNNKKDHYVSEYNCFSRFAQPKVDIYIYEKIP